MAASVELEEESLDGKAQDDSDGDATWSDRLTVRSQPLYTPIKKVFDKGISGEDAPLEKKGRKTTMGRRRARHPSEARSSPPSPSSLFSISLHRNMPPRTARTQLSMALRDRCSRSMRSAETSWRNGTRETTS